jgi:hypothetical protein
MAKRKRDPLRTAAADVTERKRAEDALERSQRFVRKIADATPTWSFG